MEESKKDKNPSKLRTIYDDLRESIKPKSEIHDATKDNYRIIEAQETNAERLFKYYNKALENYPELKQVVIIQRDSNEFTARSIPKEGENNQSGQHEIYLDLTPGSETRLLEELQPRQETLAYVARRLGISQQDLDAKTLQAYVLLHELGHSLDHIKTKRDPEERAKLRGEEMDRLPIRKATIKKLTDKNVQDFLISEHPNIFEELSELYNTDIKNFDDVIRLQEREYKKLPSELYADNFALSIMNNRPFDTNQTT